MNKAFKLLLIPLLFLTSCASHNQTENSEPSSGSIKTPIEIEATNEYEKEDVIIHRDNLKIAGEFYTPKNSKDLFPLVICSHGFGGNMSSTRDVAISFAKEGVASFVFDFIGGGTSIKSDGQMTEMSVLTEAKDLNAVINELKTYENIDPDNIFLLGQSQGGFVSTYCACTRDDIKALMAFYPAYCIRDDAEKAYDSVDKVPATYSVLGFATVGKIYYVDAVSFDIYELMENYQNNVLLLHGTADNVVPYSYAVKASETFPNVEFITYQNAGHGFSGQDNTDSINRSITFLKENL